MDKGIQLETQQTLWHPTGNNQFTGLTGQNSKDLQYNGVPDFQPYDIQNRWGPCSINLLENDKEPRKLIIGSEFRSNQTIDLQVSIQVRVVDTTMQPHYREVVPKNPVDYFVYLPTADGDVRISLIPRDPSALKASKTNYISNPINSAFSSLSIGCPSTRTVDLSGVTNDQWDMTLNVLGGDPLYFALNAAPSSLSSSSSSSFLFYVEETVPSPSASITSFTSTSLFIVIFGCFIIFAVAILGLVFLLRA